MTKEATKKKRKGADQKRPLMKKEAIQKRK
jgi:hypothetical protein